MRERDEWKTTFKIKFGLHEWLVMPFALTNAPSTFMGLMNHVLRILIGKFTFCTNEVVFLGFVVGSHGVKVDNEKVKAIQSWPTAKSVSDVRSFHGFASFYIRFVKNFSTLGAHLNEIVKKNVGFKWVFVPRCFKECAINQVGAGPVSGQ
ncbi:Retrovirus-related Pol polyprotein from transposon gypsy, partial [Mucuna pruriens]